MGSATRSSHRPRASAAQQPNAAVGVATCNMHASSLLITHTTMRRRAYILYVGVGRRALLSQTFGALTAAAAPGSAQAAINKDSDWPLWPALPVAPYSRRKTIRREVGPGVWAFDQLIGIYYVHVPIRMTVISLKTGGLVVYAPVAPTRECLSLLQPLIDATKPTPQLRTSSCKAMRCIERVSI